MLIPLRLAAQFMAMVVAALVLGGAAQAEDRIEVGDERSHRQPQFSYYLDKSKSLTIDAVMSTDVSPAFRIGEKVEPQFGFADSGIWLRLRLSNQSDRRISRYLVLVTNFMVDIRVWRTEGGEPKLLMSQNERSIFAARPTPHPNLVIPFELEPGEKTEVYINYSSLGGTSLPLQIETPVTFTQWSQERTAKLFGYYAVMFVFIMISLVSFAVTPRFIFFAYACYAISVILYISHMDGIAFQYLWPNAPGWNNFASLPLGCLVGVSMTIFARSFLNTRETNPIADRWLVTFGTVCALFVASPLLIGESKAKAWAMVWTTMGSFSFFIIGLQTLRRKEAQNVFFVLGWLGIVVGTVIVTANNVFEIDLRRTFTFDVVRMSMVFDAVMMGLAVLAGILMLRRERDLSLREKLAESERNLRLHERLNAIESKYSAAVAESEKRGRALVDASHDIRQPLYALRASLHAMEKGGRAKSDFNTLERSLTYIEALIEEHLSREVNISPGEELMSIAATPAEIVLQAVSTMFEAEAASAGKKLRVVRSTAKLAADPVVLLRIVSNLVSNAVKHADTDRVLVGCRRNGEFVRLIVVDAGQGLPEEEIARLRGRGERGAGAAEGDGGYGLGLDIAGRLAIENSMKLDIESNLGRGSVFSILIRRAA